ncbi:unnamed protein product [Adineta steineri]|uniref:Uncharacterized protein n=1 Tax=Adineta steineri TaxID=433720 RepID=A0A814SDP6_9BILA|nr:unnamed protein product [Adineta steineri]
MNRIDEEEDNTDIAAVMITDDTTTFTLVDQFPSVQPAPVYSSSDSIYSSKQTSNTSSRSKYQTASRPTSLSPTRHLLSSNDNVIKDVKKRRRHASDSNTNHIKSIPTSLVISFLRHLRNELRATSDKKNDYQQHIKQKSSARTNRTQILTIDLKMSNENLSTTNDNNEILTLIDLLVLRVECLANENKLISKKKHKKDNCPSVAEVDQNLIEYLYYLFTRFIHDETNSSNILRIPIIDKNNFVSVCQTLVRNGCFDIPQPSVELSPDQSSSDTTSSSDKTLTQQTFVREYNPDTDTMLAEKSSIDGENLSTTSAEQETWLIVDLEGTQSEDSMATSETMCHLPLSSSDEQLLITNDNYRSFESESSPSIYLSPNSSSIDIQNMVQELDDINNPSSTSFNQDGSLLNVVSESKTTISTDSLNDNTQSNNNICTRLTNDDSAIENSEPITMNNTDKMSRREKKMHERWTVSTKTDKNDNEQSSTKALLTVEFPPIAVLRRKVSPSSSSTTIDKKDKNEIETEINTDDKLNSTQSTNTEEINTSPTIIMVNKTNPDQIVELSLEDTPAMIITDVSKNNDDGQLPVTVSEVICLSEEEIMMRVKQGPLLSTTMECPTDTITNLNHESVDNQLTNEENSSAVITNPSDSNLMSSSLPLISIAPPPSLTLTTDENKSIEPLSKEKGEEKIEEEQRCNDDYNADEEKKNISSFIHDYHASGIILINDDPAQTALLHEEKKEKEEEEEGERERPSSPLPTLEQFNQQRTEDESPVQTPSNALNTMATANIDENEELYKKVEIEEIPDDEEEVISAQNDESIEPTDYIHTDDEPKQSSSSSQSNNTTINDDSLKFGNVLSCYEKALSKVADTTYDESLEPSIAVLAKESLITPQEPANDPIALRALQRFEERMNAAAAAVKTTREDTNSLANKGKSPWSASLSTSRKSLENLLKDEEQQFRSTAVSFNDELKSASSSSQADSYIRPRKTFDDNSLNYGTALNLFTTTNSTTDHKTNNDDDDQKLEEEEQQQQPSTIVENDDDKRVVVDNKSMMSADIKDQHDEEKQDIVDDTINTNKNDLINEAENSNILSSTISSDNARINSSLDTVISQSSTTEQPAFTPYRFQLEGRRRLNTVERMRERQSRESLTMTDQQQQPTVVDQTDYTVKSEEIQDPIIRRALERFDEKNRTLTQTKSMNYDEIQDPVTRRALMRLESNLKRTIPPTPPTTTNDSNETWYTENYTLGSLQPANDRLSRYSESSQSPTFNNKAKHISIHQRYGAPSSSTDMSTANNMNSTNENNIPVMRVPAQPIYVTSNNQQQQQQQLQPLSLRQRSRSEDMLTSRDLVIGQTTNLDDVDISNQLQRNRSSNEMSTNQSGFHLPNTLIKSLEPTFVRTAESSTSYATPTQSYSTYSCEYTRPRRNVGLPSIETSTSFNQETNQLPPKYGQQNDIQRPTPYRPAVENQYQTQPSSAFAAPLRSATIPSTNNYYSQQSLPAPSYNSMYTSNNSNQSPYSDDPIVRRALERFNSQIQNSLISTNQYQQPNNYSSHQGNFQDNYPNSNRSTLMTTSTSSNSSMGGYQSIIGRRRQTRHDDLNNSYIDNTSIGDGYSSSIFGNSHNPYTMGNQYMNMADEPPAIPPRFRRENFRNDDINDAYRRHSIDEYLSENINNNNNNSSQTLPRDTFIHHAYPATITNSSGFRPIDNHYNEQFDSYNSILQEQDDLRDRVPSPSSIHSSESSKQQRPTRPSHIRAPMIHTQRLPPPSVSTRTNLHQQNGRRNNEQMMSNKMSPDNSQSPPSGQNNGHISGDSVFHRLAYTGTKASLSKSSSNSCSNLLNKNSSQIPSNNLKSCEIEFEETSKPIENNNTNDEISLLTNKCQRSKSVDGRARLKNLQSRTASTTTNNNNNQTIIDHEENDIDDEQRTVPSSKFMPINNGRRDGPSPRVPLTPTSAYRTSSLKRPSNGTSFTYTKDNQGIRTQSYNGTPLESESQQPEIENDENMSYNDDNYQPKILDNRIRTAIPVHRYGNNNNHNHNQPSQPISSVTNTPSRIKPPTIIPITFDRRDSNSSTTDVNNRTPRRTDEHRRSSPTGQRRNIPVSVFSPAKHDTKRPAPAPPTYNYESQQPTSYSARLSTNDNHYTHKTNEQDVDNKISSTNSDLKTSTGNLMNEFTTTTDKHDNNNNNNNNKKMNVFERLFRGNKKKS